MQVERVSETGLRPWLCLKTGSIPPLDLGIEKVLDLTKAPMGQVHIEVPVAPHRTMVVTLSARTLSPAKSPPRIALGYRGTGGRHLVVAP